MVLPGRYQPLQDQDLEVLEHVRVLPTHDLHEFRRQLERGLLEAQILRRGGQDEAEVDVDEVTVALQQDIAIVPGRVAISRKIFRRSVKRSAIPVLDLDEVTDEAVGGAALHEVLLRREEALGGHRAVLLDEILE